MDFYIINRDTITRRGAPGQRSSNLDLILISPDLVKNAEYKIIPDTWRSDHYSIEVTLASFTPKPYKKVTNRISIKNTDWSKYVDTMNDKWSRYADTKESTNSNKYLEIYETLTEDMREAVIKANKKTNSGDSARASSRNKDELPKYNNNPVE